MMRGMSMFAENRLISYGSYSAAAGRASVAAARSSGVRYAGQDPMSAAERQQQSEAQRVLSYYAPPQAPNAIRNRTVYNVAQLETQARTDLLNTGYSEIYPEISTFFQTIKGLPQDQQDNIMSTLRQQANASVDKAFDSEAGFINAAKTAKLKNYDDQLALIKKGEQQALEKNLGVLAQGTSSGVQSNYATQAQGHNADSGQLGSYADRLIQQFNLQSKQEKDSSQLAVDKAQQQRDAASSLTSLAAESDLMDVANQRTAAQQQRLSQLMGLNASQDMLIQAPTALQTSIVKAPSAPIATSGAFVRSPYGNRTSDVGIAANARAGLGTTVTPPKPTTSSTRAPYGNRTSAAGVAANARAGYFLP